jgi:assimilatory nitrate reductase catalytic subunit
VTAEGGIASTCPYCGVGCGVVARDGTVTGDPAHPANLGRLCSKGSALAETLIDAGRLTHPVVDGKPVKWDFALDRIAARFRQTIAEHGSDAVAFYVSGQCLTEDYYVANKLMKGFIGSANIDTNSRLCMASSVAGHVRAFGEDIVPGIYADWEQADLVVLVGSNAAWCHPVLYQRMIAARQTRGTRVVVIDPRRTATADSADLHLPLRPGSDVTLFAGLLVALAERGFVNLGWVGARTRGFPDALAAAREIAPSPADVAAATGLDAADLTRFYDWFAATERTLTVYSQGVNQSVAGTDKVNAIINCHLATGRIGRPGMGPFSITGQPNAMGGREVGGLANQLAAHMGFEAESIDRVRRFWNAPHVAAQPGLRAVELFDAVADGRVKALWIMATNPAASMPRTDHVREALERCPFVVVSDCWPTEATARAQVVLPAAAWGEKDGTVTNSERVISRQRAFREAPGEARPDWWAMAEVGRRMGWADAFAWRHPAEIFAEHARLSAFENDGARLFDIGAAARLDRADYDALAPFRWPWRADGEATGRLFGDGIFATPDRRARFVATGWRPPAALPTPAFPFVLNTGRNRDQWHTMTRTGLVPRLMRHAEEPVIEIHPGDASQLGIGDGSLVRVGSRDGSAVLRARLTDRVGRGEAFAAMHWTDRFASAGPIDRLIAGATDPVSGQPELKATPVSLESLPTHWRGLILSRHPCRPSGELSWSQMPVEGGHLTTLEGWEEPPTEDPEGTWTAALLGGIDLGDPLLERVEIEDRARGLRRNALFRAGRLEACLFLALKPAAQLPGRETAAALLAADWDETGRVAAVAGRLAGGSTSGGRVVCACFSVGLTTLHQAIAAQHLASVEAIGAALRAGTNCGSCIPELRDILRDAAHPAEVSLPAA